MAQPPTIERRLPAPPRYHLGRTFSSLRLGRYDPTFRLTERSVMAARRTPAGPAVVRFDREADELRVRARGDGARWIVDRVEPMLGFEDDPSAFRPTDRVMGGLARRFAGMHLPRIPRVHDRLVQIVLQQLVSWREAVGVWSRLVHSLGEPAPGVPDLWLPPAPEVLARTGVQDLIALGVGPRQARTLRLVAREAARIEDAADRGGEVLARFLKTVPGVGQWTAASLRGSALGEPDAVMLGDYNLPHTIGWLLAGEPRGDDARMLELLEPYRGHRFRVVRLVWANGVYAPRRGPRMALRDRPGAPPA